MLGFFLVGAIAKASVAGEFAVLVDYPQAYDLVAIFHQLFDEPFNGVIGVIIIVSAAEKSSRSLGVLVVFVFGGYGEGVVGCITVVESVERDSALVFPWKY